MAEIWFIRHGESVSNAGGHSETVESIPLTENGHRQAHETAANLSFAPDLIVTSPFMRTQQTAAPCIARFPQAVHETWQIHEFTFLEPKKYKGTTRFDRTPHADAYFDRNDPDHIEGPGAESFNQLLTRIHDMIDKLNKSPHARIVVFAHGYLMHTLEIMLKEPHLTSAELMQRLNGTRKGAHMPNMHIIRAHTTNGNLTLANDNNPSLKEMPAWPKLK